MTQSTPITISSLISFPIIKKLFFFFLASFLVPNLAISNYYFSAKVSASDPCCIAFSAGSHSGQPTESMWSVEVDGSVYNFANDGNDFLHCVDGNGTFTVDFLVVGYNGVYWTRDIAVTNCEDACCLPPAIDDISVVQMPNVFPPTYEVCVENDCPDAEFRFRCREVGSSTWLLTGPPDNCTWEQFEDCKDYEVQVALWTPECGDTGFSDSFVYTTDCDACCLVPDIGDITVTEVPNTSPPTFNVCLENDCPDADYRFRCREVGTSTWLTTGWVTSNCMLEQFEECKIYEIQVAVSSDVCGQTAFSDSFFYGEECTDCCFFIDPVIMNPLPSCDGVTLCINPLFADDSFCPSTTFTFGLYNEDGQIISLPFTSTNNCVTYPALDLCNIYFIRGSVQAPGGCPPKSFNVEIDIRICCKGGDGDGKGGSDGPKGTIVFGNGTTPIGTGGGIGGGIPLPRTIVVSPDQKWLQDIAVTPNPFDSNVEFSFLSLVEDAYEIGLYDVNGVLISEERGQTKTGENKVAINYLNHLAPGIYLYRIRVQDQVYTERLIKK